ncbi:12089_t:CDS:2 [Dentiscutata erythropus]|uniref:12089_t:CDS:1 n=1 Tax=Dentiscutata erythropus TaxID=1348616 RepID=A0A9N8ZLE0_9GLOM|nr:12089_t:CDS:2 [Dentiscutata erythropus]
MNSSAHPRSLSSAFERAFRQRSKEFHVFHEPFCQEFTDRKQQLKCGYLNSTVEPLFFSTLNNIFNPYYYENDQSKPLRVFIGSSMQTIEIIKKIRHTFLIRNPEKSIKSLYKACLETDKIYLKYLNRSKNCFKTVSPGLMNLKNYFDLIKNVTDEKIVLVDADDLEREPKKVLRKYCEMIGIKFKNVMLDWKAENVQWGTWRGFINNSWLKNAEQSTGFGKIIKKEDEIEYPQSHGLGPVLQPGEKLMNFFAEFSLGTYH